MRQIAGAAAQIDGQLDALRQQSETACGVHGDDSCFPGVPDCADVDNLAPQYADSIVTAISSTKFDFDDRVFGVHYDDADDQTTLFMGGPQRGTPGDAYYIPFHGFGHLSRAGPIVEIFALADPQKEEE